MPCHTRNDDETWISNAMDIAVPPCAFILIPWSSLLEMDAETMSCLGAYSLVIKLMNSLTHSCTVSLASLAIFALPGKAFFMILLMLAIGRNLSCSLTPEPSSNASAIQYTSSLTDVVDLKSLPTKWKPAAFTLHHWAQFRKLRQTP